MKKKVFTFCHSCDQISSKSNIQKEGRKEGRKGGRKEGRKGSFWLTVEGVTHHSWKEWEAAAHIVLTVRKAEDMQAGAQLTVSILFSPGP